MKKAQTLFSQIIAILDKKSFQKLVKEKGTDKNFKGNYSWQHLMMLLFAGLNGLTSLRKISKGVDTLKWTSSFFGFKKGIDKSSISYANNKRDSKLFEDFYYMSYAAIRSKITSSKFNFGFKNKTVKLLDSTMICLSDICFDWAKYSSTKGAVKIHTVLDHKSNLPSEIKLTNGKGADNKSAYELGFKKGDIVVADRAYCDFSLLKQWDDKEVTFVVRLKDVNYDKVRRISYHKNDDTTLEEVMIKLEGKKTKNKYPKRLRLVIVSQKYQEPVYIVTNQTSWDPFTVANLYKQRWDIEVFFKELKQNLKIKHFYGTSKNAVMIQIWIALLILLITKYLKANSKLNWGISDFISYIKLNLLLERNIYELLRIDLKLYPDKWRQSIKCCDLNLNT